jgi:NADH dehydrogenase [ubiquinone] 1 alpha subcomplex assembly factor 7
MTSCGCVTPFFTHLHAPDEFQALSQLRHSRASVNHVHLVESSPALRAVQQKKLQPWDGKNDLKIHWYDSIDDVPAADGIYTMLVAHEFFDALPFHLIEVRRLRSLTAWNLSS